MFIYGASFISGIITILSPCIWPILPVIISSSVKAGKWRPFAITAGIVSAFTLVTLSFSNLMKILNIDPYIFRVISIGVIFISGLIMVVPRISEFVEGNLSRLLASHRIHTTDRTGTIEGFLTGASLGILWTPCTGPILATISLLAASQKVTSFSFFIIFFYALGVGIPILVLSFGENWLAKHHPFFLRYTHRIQQFFGYIILFSAVLMFTNYDKIIQTYFLERFPIFLDLQQNYDLNAQQQFEFKLQLLKEKRINLPLLPQKSLTDSLPVYPTSLPSRYTSSLPNLGFSKEIRGLTNWLNTNTPENYSLSSLRGKVVLLDFWSYTCAPCLPGIAYKNDWLRKYKSQGFEVVSIHTPGYEEAKSIENIQKAIDQYQVSYPVGVDNNYTMWDMYNNHSFPSEYLIDKKGFIRYSATSAGDYDIMERSIQDLLKE